MIVAVFAAVGLSLALLPAAPAFAHSGGRAQLYVASIHLEPQAGGWLIETVVRDADSGRPEPGFGVDITASGPEGAAFGPVHLVDADAEGRYGAVVPMTEGRWALTVHADEIPGGPRALPFTRTWALTLHGGQSLDLASSRPAAVPGGSGGESDALPLGLRLMAATAVLGLGCTWFIRRRGRLGDKRRKRGQRAGGPFAPPRPRRRPPAPSAS